VSELVRAGLRALEQNEKEDKLRLRAPRRLAKQTFDDVDRDKYEAVAPDGMDAFISKVDAKVRASKS